MRTIATLTTYAIATWTGVAIAQGHADIGNVSIFLLCLFALLMRAGTFHRPFRTTAPKADIIARIHASSDEIANEHDRRWQGMSGKPRF